MKLAYGGVVMDTTGRVLLREVAGQYAGYVWSFAKGRPDPRESPREAALREVHEEMGVRPRIVCPIPEAFDGQVTRSHFFLMEVHADAVDTGFRSNETASVRWADRQEAARLLALTHDATGRARDLGVLAAALAVWEGRG
jgi:8-oxo-dGTP pyrophosphatase MutT (NUDIX family)